MKKVIVAICEIIIGISVFVGIVLISSKLNVPTAAVICGILGLIALGYNMGKKD